MKRLIRIIFLILCMVGYLPTQAQFLKKLGKKISKAAENTVTRKSANKTSEEVGKGMDGIFSGMKGKKGKRAVAAPDHFYSFDYHYKMRVSADGRTMLLDYFFKPNRDYAGMVLEKSGMKMFMVFDYDKEAMYSFIAGKGNKMYTATSLDLGTENDWANNPYTKSDYTVTDLPNKTILGYSCKGKQIENDEWKFTMYYTDDIGVSFQNILNASKEWKSPSVFSKYFKDAENGMMMYMKSIDKKQKDKSITMECVGLDKQKNDFSTKNYQPMGF